MLSDATVSREHEIETLRRVSQQPIPKLSEAAPWVGTWLDHVLATALERSPARRYASAQFFADALADAAVKSGEIPASHAEVATLVRELVGPVIERHRAEIRERVSGAFRQPIIPLPRAESVTPVRVVPADQVDEDAMDDESMLADTRPAGDIELRQARQFALEGRARARRPSPPRPPRAPLGRRLPARRRRREHGRPPTRR